MLRKRFQKVWDKTFYRPPLNPSHSNHKEGFMRSHNTFINLILSTILVLLVGCGWSSSIRAEEPTAASPSVQDEKEASSVSGEVQERGIRQMPMGGQIMGTLEPVGFSCDPKTKTCTCRKSKAGDCTLMNALVCGTKPTCPGSSQTCTCTAIR